MFLQKTYQQFYVNKFLKRQMLFVKNEEGIIKYTVLIQEKKEEDDLLGGIIWRLINKNAAVSIKIQCKFLRQ